MALTFYPNLAEEHDKGAYLGYFVNSRNANGNYELHFDSQSDFLRLIGNGLYLSSDLEYDFETELIYNVSPEGLITYYQVGVQQAVKFVYDDLDFDWAYADLTFVDILSLISPNFFIFLDSSISFIGSDICNLISSFMH